MQPFYDGSIQNKSKSGNECSDLCAEEVGSTYTEAN